MFDPPVKTVATLTRAIKPGLYEVRYPNGKTATAHLSKALASAKASPAEGQQVLLELTPFDFDSARITEIRDAPSAATPPCDPGASPEK